MKYHPFLLEREVSSIFTGTLRTTFSLSFVGGSKSAEGGSKSANVFGPGGGSISASGFGPGVPNPLGHPGIFETPKGIDDLQIASLIDQISVLGGVVVPVVDVGCQREVSGHGKGRVKSIPKADRRIGKRVSQIVLKMSGKLVQSGFFK